MEVDYFREELLPALKELLLNRADSTEYTLYQVLEEAKAPLTTFLDLAPRDSKEKQDIESGSLPAARGVTLFNASFKHGVLSLAEELNASEHYCARLLEHVLPDATQSVNAITVQRAILSRYDERSAMLASFRLIFEAATIVDAPQSRVSDFLQKFMFDAVQGPYSGGLGQPAVNFASKVVSEIDAIAGEITRLDARATSADESTVDWIKTLIQRLREQRQQCAHLLYLVSAAGQLHTADVLALIKWLSKVSDGNDNVAVYVLISLFEATSPLEDDDGSPEVARVFSDPHLFVAVSSALNSRWQNADLHSAMLLQYSLFHLEVRSRDTHVRGEVSVIEDEVGASLKKAISAGAFQAITRIILRSRDPRHSAERPEFSLSADNSILSGRAAHPDAIDERALVSPEFRMYLLRSIDNLLTALIKRLSRTLRDVRKQEEDIIHGSKAPRNYSTPLPADKADSSAADDPAANSIGSLFRLIAIIYDEQPLDSALRFWTDDDGGKYFSFLRWAAESRQPATVVGMLDMMMSLSRGQSCAVFAYNFLSTGGDHYTGTEETSYTVANACSWSTLFMALHHYETRLPVSHGTGAPAVAVVGGQTSGIFPGSGAAPVQPRFALEPDEVAMLGSFLRVLRNVARFSPVARLALHDNRDFRAVQTMFTLASHSIPLELKAMLFDALAAFATQGGGSVVTDLVHQMWGILEKMEIIPVRGTSTPPVLSGRSGRPVGGAVVELEIVEVGGRTYPATLAFIQLLNALIHTPQTALTLRGDIEADSNTIPTNLGAGYRYPGLKPYVDFVIEKIFVKIFDREYAYADEKWQLMEACLCFIEKSLESFDLSPLFGREFATWPALSPSSRTRIVSVLCALVTHPGFFVMKNILGQLSVRRNILRVVDTDVTPAIAGLHWSYSRSKSALRAFRIIYRVLQVQEAFAEVLIPTLNEAGELPGVGHSGFALSSLLPLDAYISQTPQIIPRIALYATLDDPAIPFFVVLILRGLSDHPNFSWTGTLDPLVAAMEISSHHRIIAGFVGWLECDVDENVEELEGLNSLFSNDTGFGVPKANDVRHAILDMLIHNTRISSPPHNIAHLFLGLHRGPSLECVIDDPSTYVRTCLHAILNLVNRGVVPQQHRLRRTLPLSQTHALLADKCYKLIHQLCVHPWSSGSIIRYLRSREHFLQQLTILPIKIPSVPHTNTGRISFPDDVSFETSSHVVTSCLRAQSSILQCLALEIRLLHETRQNSRVDTLIDGLFGTATPTTPEDGAGPRDPSLPGQSPTRMLHLLDGLLFQWTETALLSPVNLRLFQGVNWEASLRTDENGCLVYDSRQLVTMLKNARAALQRAGSLSTAGANQQLHEETDFILKSAVRENNIRQISYARDSSLAAWAALLEVVLTNGFNAIRVERQEAIIHDLLVALPHHISASGSATASTLSSTFLLLVSKLREFIAQQSLLSTPTVSSLPSERFHVHLKNIFECLLQHGTTERTRGNLYAALIRYLQMIQDLDDAAGVFHEESSRDFAKWSGGAASARLPTSSYSGTIKIVNVAAERFVPIVCRDAIDGSEVWKTVSLTLLGMLVRLTRKERSQRVLSTIVKGGFLQTIVGSIAQGNDELVRVLQPNTNSLNGLYVYEAKMTFFMRLSEYRGGAERLVESQIFAGLSALEVLDAGSTFISESRDGEGFIPTAAERYVQLLIPALEVTVGCLSAIGTPVISVMRQGFEFLSAHRDTFVALLSERTPRWPSAGIRAIELLVTAAALVFDHAKNNAESFKPLHMAIMSLAQHCYSDARSGVSAPSCEPLYPYASRNGALYGFSPESLAAYAGAAALPTLPNAFASLLKRIVSYMVTATKSSTNFAKVYSIDFVTTPGSVGLHAGRTPAFENILSVLAADIQQLYSHVQLCYELGCTSRDIERIALEDIEETLKRAHVLNASEAWTFEQKRTVAAKLLSEELKTHTQNVMDILYRTEIQLSLVATLLEDFLQARPTLAAQTSAARDPSPIHAQRLVREFVALNLFEPMSALEHLDLDILTNFDATSQHAFVVSLIKKIRAMVAPDDDERINM